MPNGGECTSGVREHVRPPLTRRLRNRRGSEGTHRRGVFADADATPNKHETVVWGQFEGTKALQIEMQFLRVSVREYIRRLKKVNDEYGNATASSLLSGVFAALLGVIAFSPLVALIVLPLVVGMPFQGWMLSLPVISIVTLIAMSVLSRRKDASDERAWATLREKLGRAVNECAETTCVEVDADDLRERHGTSPVKAAMVDRINSDASDSIVALLKAGEQEAVEHIVRTLIEEERDLIDGRQYAENGANKARIEEITAEVLAKTRRGQ